MSNRKRSLSQAVIATEADSPSKRSKASPSQATEDQLHGQIVVQNGYSQDENSETAEEEVDQDEDDDEEESDSTPKATRPGRPPKSRDSQATTPRANRLLNFTTPTKAAAHGFMTPRKQAAADRSARKKSARVLIQQAVQDGDSGDEQLQANLAREIYGSSDEDGEHSQDGAEDDETIPIAETLELAQAGEGDPVGTPSKTKPKGRPRRKREKSPTPPRDLPPHESYFFHNKPGKPKTSDNVLPSSATLSHEEYFDILRDWKDPHHADIDYLESLHAESFPQWMFELSQGFSVCLYGFGSKRRLLRRFASYSATAAAATSSARTDSDSSKKKKKPTERNHKIVMVNGYAHGITMRELLSVINTAIQPGQRIPTSQPTTMLQTLLTNLSHAKDTFLTLIVNSIDAPPLRRHAPQALLSRLASHPQISLLCSADTPDFSLLWDIGVRSAFSFVFHDCTTFAPFTAELDVVDDVNELLNRSSRRVNGREGVAFVLKSLPENAKNLFRLLVGEVLIATDEEGGGGGGAADGEESAGVEYRMMYNKAVEEFVCSSEMAFRTLLKEFHDHQMITSRKDALGTEMLSVPFPREELEAILEDLTT